MADIEDQRKKPEGSGLPGHGGNGVERRKKRLAESGTGDLSKMLMQGADALVIDNDGKAGGSLVSGEDLLAGKLQGNSEVPGIEELDLGGDDGDTDLLTGENEVDNEDDVEVNDISAELKKDGFEVMPRQEKEKDNEDLSKLSVGERRARLRAQNVPVEHGPESKIIPTTKDGAAWSTAHQERQAARRGLAVAHEMSPAEAAKRWEEDIWERFSNFMFNVGQNNALDGQARKQLAKWKKLFPDAFAGNGSDLDVLAKIESQIDIIAATRESRDTEIEMKTAQQEAFRTLTRILKGRKFMASKTEVERGEKMQEIVSEILLMRALVDMIPADMQAQLPERLSLLNELRIAQGTTSSLIKKNNVENERDTQIAQLQVAEARARALGRVVGDGAQGAVRRVVHDGTLGLVDIFIGQDGIGAKAINFVRFDMIPVASTAEGLTGLVSGIASGCVFYYVALASPGMSAGMGILIGLAGAGAGKAIKDWINSRNGKSDDTDQGGDDMLDGGQAATEGEVLTPEEAVRRRRMGQSGRDEFLQN
ncbi:MAG TPA: hypothetical protein VF828_04075 [Patescibacteria group bacterium]